MSNIIAIMNVLMTDSLVSAATIYSLWNGSTLRIEGEILLTVDMREAGFNPWCVCSYYVIRWNMKITVIIWPFESSYKTITFTFYHSR